MKNLGKQQLAHTACYCHYYSNDALVDVTCPNTRLLLARCGSLADHPNIVRLQEVFQTPDYLFLVMDLYTGGNLLESYQFHSEAAAADIISHITNAVRYCHDRHIAVSIGSTASAASTASSASVQQQFAVMRAAAIATAVLLFCALETHAGCCCCSNQQSPMNCGADML
eukprot:12174-Heterococcus_DN1.PRE.1